MDGPRRREHRRAFRSLTWTVVAFAGVQACLSVIIEASQPDLCDADYGVKEEHLRARLREKPNRRLVLLLGSSRAKLGLKGGEVRPGGHDTSFLVYNFGLAGSGPVLELLCLRRLLALGIHPDFLFLEVMPPALTQSKGYPFEGHWFRGGQMQTGEIAWLRTYSSEPWNLLWQWVAARCLPCKHCRDGLRYRLGIDIRSIFAESEEEPPRVDAFGWQPQLKKVTREQRALFTNLTHGQYDSALAGSHLSWQSTRALEELLALCQARTIPVALVLMPEASHLRACYSPGLRVSLHDLLTRLQQQWHVPVIDAREWVADMHFWDGHHLLPTGADAFTARFEREALRPLVFGEKEPPTIYRESELGRAALLSRPR